MQTIPKFGTRHVVAVLGLATVTINRWFACGYLDGLDCADTVRRKERQFTYEDVCHVAVLAALVRLGVAPAAAAPLAQEAIDAVDLGHTRTLTYREYPDGRGVMTLDERPFPPGAALTMALHMDVMFSRLADRLRASLATDASANAPAD